MKHKNISLLLVSLFSLVGCTPSNIPSNSLNNSTSSSPTSKTSKPDNSSIEEIVLNSQFIFDKLHEASKGDFGLSYEFQGKEFKDVYSGEYIYKGYLNSGSILLPFATSKRVVDFKLNDNKVELLGQAYSQVSNEQGLSSLDEFNKLSSLFDESSSFSTSDIEETSDGFISVSSSLIKVLSSLLDFSEGVSKIEFSLSDSNDLVIELKVKQPDGSLITPDGGKVYLKDIGQSNLSLLDDFIKSWNAPTSNAINKAENLKSTNISFTTNIYEASQTKKLIQSQTFDSNNGLFKITKKNADGLLFSNEVLKKNNDNTLNQLSIDGQNKQVDEKSTLYQTVDELNLISEDKLNLSEFYLQNDGTYLYLGNKSSSFLPTVVKDSTFWKYNIAQASLTTKNNNISSIRIISELLQDSLTGEIFTYEFEINFLDKVNSIEVPSKKNPSGNDTDIQLYFSKFTSEDSNFVAVKQDSAWEGKRRTYFTKSENVYLIETYGMIGEEKQYVESGKGFYLKNGKTYEFIYQNGKYVVQGSGSESTLSSKINWTASSEVFYIDNKDSLLKTYDDISYIGKSIAFSDYPLDVVSSSLKMTVANNAISKIIYDYSNKEISGSETIDITYGNAVLYSAIKKELDAQIPEEVVRKTWKDDKSQVVYDALVESFGEKIANLVPYLYDEKLNGTFDGYENDINDFRVYSMGDGLTDEEKNAYLQNYKNLLVELGYTSSDNTTYTNSNDNLKIIVGPSLDEFLQIGLIK